MRVRLGEKDSRVPVNSRRRHLAASLAAALELAAMPALATANTAIVGTCTEDALRAAVTLVDNDSSYDTIDLSGLTCSSISLANGELAIGSSDMTIKGPSDRVLAIGIQGVNFARLFDHYGHGTLEIDYLTVQNGNANGIGEPPGGCIFSAGSVRLNHSSAVHCEAGGNGGAIYAISSVQLHYSTISGSSGRAGGAAAVHAGGYIHAYSSYIDSNEAVNGGGFYATTISLSGTRVVGNGAGLRGGGIYGTTINLDYSTVTGNKTLESSGVGGGIVGNSVTIQHSTIDNNYSAAVGAIYANQLSIINSTISSNGAKGSVNVSTNGLILNNSTVAYNTSKGSGCAGIFVATSAQIQSSIIARNRVLVSSGVDDLAIKTGASITTSANLIVGSTVDTGAIVADPQLTPLAYHGGPTRVHALLATSPAVNAGTNPDGLLTDQRGGVFTRVVGANADIGAYERQPNDDEIFANGFD